MNLEEIKEAKSEAEEKIRKILVYLVEETECKYSDIHVDYQIQQMIGVETITIFNKVDIKLNI